MVIADAARLVRVAVDHHVGPGFLAVGFHAVEHFVPAAVLEGQVPPEGQGRFQRADELVFHGMMIRRERPPIAVLQHRRDDRGDLARAGVQIAAVGIGLMAVEEGESPPANGLLEAPHLSQEQAGGPASSPVGQ